VESSEASSEPSSAGGETDEAAGRGRASGFEGDVARFPARLPDGSPRLAPSMTRAASVESTEAPGEARGRAEHISGDSTGPR
jgi:hypothetical protein